MFDQRQEPMMTTINPYLDEVCSLNTRATEELQSGDLNQASRTFTRALHCLKTSYSIENQTAAASQAFPTTFVESSFSKTEDWFHRTNLLSCPDQSAKDQFVHTHPIILSLEASESERTMSHSRILQMLSYGVVYNLGLCRHLQGLYLMGLEQDHGYVKNPVAQSYLKQAADLYLHSQRLLIHHNPDLGILYGLTLINNVGHVYRTLGEDIDAQRCYSSLFKAIICVKNAHFSMSTNSQDNQTLSLMEDFLSYILTLWVGSPTIAPAA